MCKAFPLFQVWCLSLGASIFCSATTIVRAQDVSAFIEPYRQIEIASGEIGLLKELSVREGQEVKAGQILARLDESLLLATLEMSKSALNAKGKIKLAQAELDQAKRKHEKVVGLRERNHASQVELERAQSQVEIAEAQLEQVLDELKLKKLEIARTETQLEQLRLRSPINGLVSTITKDVGEFVSITDPVVMHVIQLDPVMIYFSVPQSQVSRLAMDGEVALLVGAENQATTGVVEFISPLADAQSSTRLVKVRLENPSRQWQCGTICKLEGFHLEHADDDLESPPPVFTNRRRVQIQ